VRKPELRSIARRRDLRPEKFRSDEPGLPVNPAHMRRKKRNMPLYHSSRAVMHFRQHSNSAPR